MQTRLRIDAEGRLAQGTAPSTNASSIGIDALRLLHTLASSPASADDALRLLHELQVHQVELDLQLGQIQANEHELAVDLALYQELYEFAPAAYFSVAPEGNIIEANLAGAELFGVQREELRGRQIGDFLAPASRPVLLGLLDRLRSGSVREACEVQCEGGGSVSQQVRALARAAPSGRVLVLFLPANDLENLQAHS